MKMKHAEKLRYFAIALDPIHIGSGGYRLGRVENTIVRDPTTDVPKIPGTSLAGVIREYVRLHLEESNDKDTEKKINKHFGDENHQGMLRIHDGQMLFFPVSSIQGTVWVTTKELLEYWLKDMEKDLEIKDEDVVYALKGIDASKPLNLGWLLLKTAPAGSISLPTGLEDFIERVALVSDKLFSQIVNDNLEVRTSVRIDPATGTAEKGLLFTYEAIPRGTVIGFEIVIDKRRGADECKSLINATFPYLRLLGIGGMGTRGFGRVDVFEVVGDNKGNSVRGGSNNG
jgi:CRISPR-associated protein Cmr4